MDCCKEHIPSKKNIQTSRYDIMNEIGKNSLLKLNILTYNTNVLLGFSEGPADMKVGKGLLHKYQKYEKVHLSKSSIR